jgi:hypothetical protein
LPIEAPNRGRAWINFSAHSYNGLPPNASISRAAQSGARRLHAVLGGDNCSALDSD